VDGEHVFDPGVLAAVGIAGAAEGVAEGKVGGRGRVGIALEGGILVAVDFGGERGGDGGGLGAEFVEEEKRGVVIKGADGKSVDQEGAGREGQGEFGAITQMRSPLGEIGGRGRLCYS
jgi:hypothetical protein